jgi:sugar phosphate isomerase/epimerase
MPWTEIDSIAKASALLTNAGCSNGGLIVDALHFHRTKTSLADLRAVPRQWLHFAQLCDAPLTPPATMEALIHQARNARLLPGQGGLDLVSFVRALPEDLPISVEIPNVELAQSMTAVNRARAALQATRDVVSLAGSAGD